MEKYKVSVIIPTYKRSDFLGRAIQSVLDQTYKNIEIIVSDDNIPESDFCIQTAAKVKAFEKTGKVRYVKTSGKTGGGPARNFAIKYCTGDYVAFLDDDDVFLPDKIEKQLDFMIENDLEMCYQDVKWFDENERLVEFRKLDYVKEFTKNEFLRQHILHSLTPTAVYMIKRDALLKTEGFGNVIMGQDFILMLRCIEADLKIGYMSGAYVHQYLHSGERISLGQNKIDGEYELYDLKKKYYPLLSKKEIRYVKFRHNAVLMFTTLRSKMYSKVLGYGLKAFFLSPTSCLQEAKRYFGGRK